MDASAPEYLPFSQLVHEPALLVELYCPFAQSMQLPSRYVPGLHDCPKLTTEHAASKSIFIMLRWRLCLGVPSTARGRATLRLESFGASKTTRRSADLFSRTTFHDRKDEPKTAAAGSGIRIRTCQNVCRDHIVQSRLPGWGSSHEEARLRATGTAPGTGRHMEPL